MRYKFIALTLTTALTVFVSSNANAKTLVGVSDWLVNDVKVGQGPAYCTLARKYQENSTVTFAKNGKGEGTIAFDFGRDVFNAAKAYTIVLNASSIKRQYKIKPASSSVIIMRTGTDASLFDAMQNTGILDVTVEGQAFTVNLDQYRTALGNLNRCVDSLGPKPVVVQADMPRPPKTDQVQDQVLLSAKNTQVESLTAENVNLVQTLESERETFRKRLAENQTSTTGGPTPDAVLVRKLVDAEQRNTQLLRQIGALETQLQSGQNAINPDITSALRASETKISLLEGEKGRLQSLLDEERSKRVALETEIVTLKARTPSSTNATASNANLTNALEAQIISLQQQNTDLRQRLDAVMAQEPKVVVKEVIREVPIAGAGVSTDMVAMAEQLAEAETNALSLKAERDEYRSLLQQERQRLKEAGDLGQQINVANAGANNMVETVRQLEAEKVDLIRQLEFARANPSPSTPTPSVDNEALENRLNDVMQESEQAKQQLRILSDDKKALQAQLARAEADIAAAKQATASSKVAQIASSNATTDLELKSLQSEIFALEAQNRILREDMAANTNRNAINSDQSNEMVKAIEQKYQNRFQAMERENIRLVNELNQEKNKTPTVIGNVIASPVPTPPVIATSSVPVLQAETVVQAPISTQVQKENNSRVSANDARRALRNKITGRPVVTTATPVLPVANVDTVEIANIPASTPAAMPKQEPRLMMELSGDDIKRLVAQSNISLASPINRVSNVSGPDFAAFRWDTGTVFGSAEQTKLSSPAAFEKSVAQYIAKTQSRCVGDFDKTILPVTVTNGLNARAADIACVQNGDSGAAASILFFESGDMFYAVAHESGLDGFQTAMQMRDQMANGLNGLF